jgi:heat shock protein HslJ
MRTALQRAASVEVTADAAGDQLVVRDAAGIEILRFEPDDVAALEAAEWRLSSYVKAGASIAADPDQVAVLAFRATERGAAERRSSGEAVGSSGCNGFLATYTRAGDVLRFGELESSDAPCIPALQAQEAAILAVLGSPETILDLPADRLILTEPESEDRLEYVTSTPLEGTTWRLERLAGSPGRLGVVTMRLSDGAVEGEGPCGSYHGTYDTDGSFITFRGVAAERSPERASTCPRADRERALLRALTDTVLVDRSGPGLRLLDVRGRVVARFSPAGAGP